MSKRNFNNYKVENDNPETNSVNEEVVDNDLKVIDNTVDDSNDDANDTFSVGTVICDKLNIRSTSEVTNDNVIAVINKNSKVVIDNNSLSSSWYKVTTETGISGFCMSEYIKID